MARVERSFMFIVSDLHFDGESELERLLHMHENSFDIVSFAWLSSVGLCMAKPLTGRL